MVTQIWEDIYVDWVVEGQNVHECKYDYKRDRGWSYLYDIE